MSKLGNLLTFAAVAGAVAAGVSYLLQNKKYQDDLNDDIDDFDDDFEYEDDKPEAAARKYTTINPEKEEEFVNAAQDAWKATKEMASAAKCIIVDYGKVAYDKAVELSSQASEKVKEYSDATVNKANAVVSQAELKAADVLENVKEKISDFNQSIVIEEESEEFETEAESKIETIVADEPEAETEVKSETENSDEAKTE